MIQDGSGIEAEESLCDTKDSENSYGTTLKWLGI